LNEVTSAGEVQEGKEIGMEEREGKGRIREGE
jgi:hypothetical protein